MDDGGWLQRNLFHSRSLHKSHPQTSRRNETLLRWPNNRDKQESPFLHVLGKHMWPLLWDMEALSTTPQHEPIKQSDIRARSD